MRRFAVMLMLVLCASLLWGQRWHLTVLHTNDLHGMMLPFNYPGQLFFTPKKPDAGGLARRATAIAQIKAQTTDHPVVLIDAGDLFTRGPWHLQFYGEPEIEALNLMGYEMMCVGNNEFKAKTGPESQQIFQALCRRSKFPWLAANLTVGNTGKPVEGVQPYIVKTYGDVRVGFLGLTSACAQSYSQVRGWTISDPIKAAKRWVPIARKECDILIAVTHLGYQQDRELAAQVSGIDAIVGGHSHTFIYQPEMVANPDGRLVPITQAGEQGVALGRLDLTFAKKGAGWRLVVTHGRLLPIDHRYQDNPAVHALLHRYLDAPKPALRPAA